MKKLLGRQKIVKNFSFEIKSVNEAEHIIEGVFSTSDVDRHGESVVQAGWDLKNYLMNPVVLWAHDSYEFPIAQMIELGIDAQGQLAGKMKFAVDEYEKAATAYSLMVGKYLRAFSVGFSNNRYEVDQNSEVTVLTENELYEVSVVNIPANQMALAKSKGIDVAAFETENKELEEKEAEEKATEMIVAGISKQIKKELRADNKTKINKIKVETPAVQGGRYSARSINKAIRLLLKSKSANKKV